MKALLALLSVLFLAGCDEHVETIFAEQAKTAQIVVVSTDNCAWCDKQMVTLERMKKAGHLKGVTVKLTKDTGMWPAKSFPTLYIRTDSGEAKYVGYQTAIAINRALGN